MKIKTLIKNVLVEQNKKITKVDLIEETRN